MKTKKSIVCIIMALSLIIGASTSALAAESDVWARWYTGNAGSANGKHNGVYHHLDSGNAYLSGYVNGATTQYPVVAVLYEDKILFDKKYGTVNIKNENYNTFQIGTNVVDCDKYYLHIGGGTHDTMHTFEGTLSNTK